MKKGVKNLHHHLNDFIFAFLLEWATTNKQTVVNIFNHFGVSLELSKLVGPVTSLKFLVIKLDTMTLQIQLPSEKLCHLNEQLAAAVSKRCMSKVRCSKPYRSTPTCNKNSMAREDFFIAYLLYKM